MKLTCPVCGGSFSLEEAARSRDLADLAEAVRIFGTDWDLVEAYLERFRTLGGLLTVKKRLAALKEIRAMWQGSRFSFGGQTFEIEPADLKAALAQVGGREDIKGLNNHNYLKKVLKAAAAKTAGRREREREAQRRSRQPSAVGRQPNAESRKPKTENVDPEWEAEFARLNQAVIREKDPAKKAELQEAFQVHVQKRKADG